MLRNAQRVIVGLMSSFVLLAVAQVTRSTDAQLLCGDLAGCKGSSGCSGYGAKEGACTLKCSDGTVVQCPGAGS